ncbi:MAG: hypothetical protein U0798_01120 [Gemmataceae bacterium]
MRLGIAILAIGICQLIWQPASEPFFNGDETRHVMTGVFVRDAILDGGFLHPRQYAEQYYAQYPALGLLIWPPAFYAVEGVAMLLCGTTFEVGRLLVFLYFVVGAAYLYGLVKRTHNAEVAFVSVLGFGLCRMVFTHAGIVMLEVPSTACFLAVAYHLERYLAITSTPAALTPETLSPATTRRRFFSLDPGKRQLILLAFWTLATSLHRYDSVILVPFFLFRLYFEGRLSLFLRRDVLIAAITVVLLAAPFWWLMVREIGKMQTFAASQGTNDEVSTGLFHLENFYFYPTAIPFQFGAIAAGFIAVGMVRSLAKSHRSAFRPYWSMVLAVYCFFTPLAELEPRHAMYWTGALAVFAASAALSVQDRRIKIILAMILIGSIAFWTLKQERNWIRGYRDAATYCIERLDGTNPVVLFDGLNDGNFIYQVRTLDPARKIWVLRGDKLVYAVRSDPNAGYIEWAKDEPAILKILHEADPAFIVVEDPPAKPEKYAIMPAAQRLRDTLRNHPELFHLETTIPVINGNQDFYKDVELLIYRKLVRNPDRGPIRMNMFWQGSSITAPLPHKK